MSSVKNIMKQSSRGGAIVTEGIATDLSSPGENTGNTFRAARPVSGTLMPCFTVSEFEK